MSRLKLLTVLFVCLLSCANVNGKKNISKKAFKTVINKTQFSFQKDLQLTVNNKATLSKFSLLDAQHEFCNVEIGDKKIVPVFQELYDTTNGVYNKVLRLEFYYSEDSTNMQKLFNNVIVNPSCIDEHQFKVDFKLMPYSNLFILVNAYNLSFDSIKNNINRVLSQEAN